jgi:hypothetical protein
VGDVRKLSLTSVVMRRNTAGLAGGGLWLYSTVYGVVDVNSSTLEGNQVRKPPLWGVKGSSRQVGGCCLLALHVLHYSLGTCWVLHCRGASIQMDTAPQGCITRTPTSHHS